MKRQRTRIAKTLMKIKTKVEQISPPKYYIHNNARKTSTFALLTTPTAFTVWITTNCGKLLKDGNTRPPDLPPENSVGRLRSNS